MSISTRLAGDLGFLHQAHDVSRHAASERSTPIRDLERNGRRQLPLGDGVERDHVGVGEYAGETRISGTRDASLVQDFVVLRSTAA